MNNFLVWEKAIIYGKRHLMQEIDYFLEKGWSPPNRVSLGLTQRCNARCLMCDFWKTKIREQDEISAKRWIEVIEELHEWIGTFFLHLVGGEVFVKKGIYDIIKRAVDLKISVDVITNGFVFRNNRNLQKLFDTGISYITFSIDGVDPEIHDRYRGTKGLFKGVEEVICKIKQQNPKMVVTASCIVMKETISQLVDYVRWAEKLGVNRVLFQPVLSNLDVLNNNTKDNDITPMNHFIQNSDLVNRCLDDLIVIKQKTNIIGNTIDNLEKIKEYFKNPDTVQIKQGRCMMGQTNLNITDCGDMWFCPKKNDRIGNVNDGPIKKTWMSHRANQNRREIKSCHLPCMSLCFRSLSIRDKIAMFFEFAKMGRL